MPPRVPCQRCNPIAGLDAVALEPLRELQRSLADLGIVRGVNRSFDRAAYDRTTAMLDRGVVDDAMAEERPILHQAKHGHFSPGRLLLLPVPRPDGCSLA